MSSDRWFVVAVVAFMVVLASVVMMVRNARLNRRDDEREMRSLRETDLDSASLVPAGRLGHPGELESGAQTVLADPPGVGEPREDQLDEEWADELAAMNAEHLNLIDHLERVHPAEPCQEWCCWERRLEAQRAAWLELVRADVTVVAEWIVAGTPGRWVPSAAGWPSDDWRGEMIPA